MFLLYSKMFWTLTRRFFCNLELMFINLFYYQRQYIFLWAKLLYKRVYPSVTHLSLTRQTFFLFSSIKTSFCLFVSLIVIFFVRPSCCLFACLFLYGYCWCSYGQFNGQVKEYNSQTGSVKNIPNSYYSILFFY